MNFILKICVRQFHEFLKSNFGRVFGHLALAAACSSWHTHTSKHYYTTRRTPVSSRLYFYGCSFRNESSSYSVLLRWSMLLEVAHQPSTTKGEISSEKISRLKKICQIAVLNYLLHCQNVNCDFFFAFTGSIYLEIL